MPTRPLAFAALVVFLLAARASGAIPPAAELPAALRPVDPRTLSSGLYLSLVSEGHFGGLALRQTALEAAGAGNKSLPPRVLDARVGDNVQLGSDSPLLPAMQRSQAEPHLWRSAADPEFLVGTFQEGRFAVGGGALDCGYTISHDGGLSWTRALIPKLTTTSGGSYVRATDPVAAVDLNGNIYLLTLAARQPSFNDGGVVVISRSTNGGGTFDAPVAIASGSATHSLDKEWLAVNDYPGTAHANRLVATYTDIGSDSVYDLFASTSDNAGVTWSTPVLLKIRDNNVDQSTQPFFLPDGSLLVPYITNYRNGGFRIECKRSTDGGTTFPGSPIVVVANVVEWLDPALRNGSFIITAWVARQSGAAFITYVGRDTAGQPRVFVTSSTDRGATWSAPVAASDNPTGVSVVNSAVAASPDGQNITVCYYDKRNAAGSNFFVDLYSNTSFDGGTSWQPGVRLTEYSSDIRAAPLTDQGYMLGDYQGLVPPFASDQPAVALTVDTRNSDGDPFAIRYALRTAADFDAWRTARFDRAELANAATSGASADPDGDGLCNAAEFLHQTNPRVADFGSLYGTSEIVSSSPTFDVIDQYRLNPGAGFSTRWESSLDGANWSAAAYKEIPNDFPQPTDNTAHLKFPVINGVPRYFREIFSPTSDFSNSVQGEVLVANTDARIVNLSARGPVKTGDSQLIVGFVTTGGAKAVLVRGVGPALGPLGVNGFLANPQLDLNAPFQPSFAVVHNDNWASGGATAALFARLGAFAFASGSLDAAIVQTLNPQPYTAILSGVNNGTGVGLVEVYDADPVPGAPAGPRLANVSSRGEVDAGENILIGGFVISGTQPKRVLIRAIGPTLADLGVAACLADPVLTLFKPTATGVAVQIARNDDWHLSANANAVAATSARVGAFALNTAGTRDSSLLLTLAPGVYSAQVTSVNSATGIALVEIYDAD